MKVFKFNKLLQDNIFLKDIFIETDDKGIISQISEKKIDGELEEVQGFFIPGFPNTHSHAFQYAMAGLSESKGGSGKDNFWSWRENMYSLALTLNPDEIQLIATKLYKEMIRHGYTSVAEFHYLHHDKNGTAYSNLSEMSERLMIAANTAGIGITIIPIFYQRGGFNQPAEKRQRRFLSRSADDYLKLFEAVNKTSKSYQNVNIGVGIHSLRAVSPQDVINVFNNTESKIPKHIHISEQTAEVEECLKIYKKRPVEWLNDNIELDESYHLVHATHINNDEVKMIAKSHANVVLCPSTEANLGDGFFPIIDFMKQNGNFSIGTDSHIGLSPMEELRWLDYGARLMQQKRTPLSFLSGMESGDILFKKTIISGRKAMGNYNNVYFKVGEPLEGILINDLAPVFESRPESKFLSTFIYSGDPSLIKGTFVNGKWL